jgi:hypothetical protein
MRHNRDLWERRFSLNYQYRNSLTGALVYALQQALKGYGITHPDSKRQRKARLRDIGHAEARKMKNCPCMD